MRPSSFFRRFPLAKLLTFALVVANSAHVLTVRAQGGIEVTFQTTGVFIQSPRPLSVYAAPASFEIAAIAGRTREGDGGEVRRVEFYQGATKIGEDSSAPYTFMVTGLTVGDYVFTAKAFDQSGVSVVSPPVPVRVIGADVRPLNDNFAAAQTITTFDRFGIFAGANGWNINATKEAGEPTHANNAGGKSVWFKWTARTSAQATISTRGSDFNTLLGIYTGTSVNALTEVASNDDETPPNNFIGFMSRTSRATFNAIANTTYYIAVDGFNSASGQIFVSVQQAPEASSTRAQFTAPTYTVAENAGSVTIGVTRTGDTSGQSSVNYMTLDVRELFNCNPTVEPRRRGIATARCDYTTTAGTLRFNAGETSKSFSIPVTNDTHVEGNETFFVALRSAIGASVGGTSHGGLTFISAAQVTITDDDTASNAPTANPVGDPQFFIRQNYLDFFGRAPSNEEVTTWTNAMQPDGCAGAECYDRLWVSGRGFFQSQEFGQKGYFAYRFYKTTLNRVPTYDEFIPDMVSLSDTSAETKQAFAEEWLARPDIAATYGNLSNDQFVQAVQQRAGVQLANPAQVANSLEQNQMTRAQVLLTVVEAPQVYGREYNEAWVVMSYFGYLRRDGAASEYDAWKQVLDRDANDYRTMVGGFVNSIEYRNRFGQP